ncbi:MAG: PEP-utilizing enzyme mobile domain [Solirubrobacterales bacterium]|nr:PEP-utilizing enzyme mobile domain [Solirubrobacterales bacterium]
MSESTFEPIGTGLTVFTDKHPVEGPVRWLDSPKAVMDFVASGTAPETIVLVRGGTTTFLTPALNAGVKGVLTLQGAPESHLGILTREYGIPCVMGVSFERGVRSARGEVIPADGAIVRLDISAAPQGHVLIEPGAPVAEEGTPTAPPAMDAETLAQIQVLLERFGGEVPHGSVGDAELRASLSTGVLHLDDASVRRALSDAEVNDLSRYAGWNMWDCLAARATEGESGLIPRQEYESISFVQIWQRYPQFLRLITDAVGADGVVELGRASRREIGTKANLLHTWALGFAVAFGRGVALELGLGEDRPEDLREGFAFQRRLYHGQWGGGEMFTSMRGYRAPLLEDSWLERFHDEHTRFTEPEQRRDFQRFSASTEMLGFLLHFDNRAGLSDTGPYPTADGGFVIVRDHFLQEEAYQWGQLAPGLPYAVTQAMYFEPDEPLDLQLVDIGTLFTEPSNYLKHLKGAAVYARDRWNTPADEVRLLDPDEMRRIQVLCDEGCSRLYPHIAGMSKREKIMAGAKVYYTDFLLPYARAAGVWDQLVEEHDFFEIDPVTSQAYYALVRDGTAAALIPRLFLTGAGFPPLPSAPEPPDPSAFPTLHALALRGMLTEAPEDAAALEAAGLIVSTPAGWMLTDTGRTGHEQLLAAERASFDRAAVAPAYDRFLTVNGKLKVLCVAWQSGGAEQRARLLSELEDLVDRARPAVRRTAKVLPRFARYDERLSVALGRALAGEEDYVLSPLRESVHTVWMELHEDYLMTQGITREEEGSY